MPKLPPELEGTWAKFLLLGPHRTEHGVNFTEMQAFSSMTGIYIGCWESSLLIRMNDAALRAWRGEAYQRDHNEDLVEQVPVTNKKGVFALFKGLVARHADKDKDQCTPS